MADWKIRYNNQFVMSPMTPWVHRRVPMDDENAPAVYDPPRPLALPGKGYATFVIVIDRFPWTFASLAEIDEAIRVLEQPTLPPVDQIAPKTKQLPVYRRFDPHGATSKHWLARLPKEMLGWARRRKIVFELRQGRDAIKKALGKANVERAYGRGGDEETRDTRHETE